MKLQGFWGDRRFVLTASVMLALAVLIVVSQVLASGHPLFSTIISDSSAIICSLIAVGFFAFTWQDTSRNETYKLIWGIAGLGMILWSLAEIIWGYIEIVLGKANPYPSIADLFWLTGYIPIYAALFIVYRVYRGKISRQQQLIIIGTTLLFAAASFFFVILPTFQGFDPAKLMESLVDIAYPTADTGLLILTIMIVFAFEKGRFSLTWQLFGIGLMLEAAGDLMFSYATWNGLYYANNQFNLVSGFIDTSLNTAYLILGLAVYSYYLIIQSFPKDKINLTLRPMTNRETLVFVTPEGSIISASENLSHFTNQPPATSYTKIPLSQTLGISQSQIDNLLRETITAETLRSQPLMNESAGIIWCPSIAIYNELKKLTCIALVLRTQLDPSDPNDVPLHEDQQMLIDYYLTRTGERQDEEKQAVQTYFLEEMNLLYSLVQQFGGENAADKLLAHLQQIASQNKWNLSFHEHEISIPEEFDGRFLGNLLSAMLR